MGSYSTLLHATPSYSKLIHTISAFQYTIPYYSTLLATPSYILNSIIAREWLTDTGDAWSDAQLTGTGDPNPECPRSEDLSSCEEPGKVMLRIFL